MHSRLYKKIGALVLIALTAGCVQATRHSNVMLFGTNTSFGIKVGTDAAQIPSVIVGYDRQEAVILPLVVNATEKAKSNNMLSPCDPSTELEATTKDQYLVHPCLLVGINGSAKDSYSVLASFGAEFDAGGASTGNKAKGGLAQYFSTGMAAQILALTGGASVVATGESAAKAAENKPDANAVSKLFNNKSAFETGTKVGINYQIFQKNLISKINGETVIGTLKNKLEAFEKAAGLDASESKKSDCGPTVKDCADDAKNDDFYLAQYTSKTASKFNDALDNW